MKQNYKNFIFSNFKNASHDFKLCKNELVSNQNFNLKLDGGAIKSLNGFSDYFYKKINDLAKYNMFFSQNEVILQKIDLIVCYKFFDEQSLKVGERYFALDSNLKLYEINFNSLEIYNFEFSFETKPHIFCEDGYLYFYSNASVVVFDKTLVPQYYDGVVNLRDYELIDDTIFFVSENYPYTIFYDERTQLINLSNNVDNYNKIELNVCDGKILKIIKFKDELFIFQQYKISSYDLYASKNIFSYKCFLNTKIIDNTICAIDDSFFFLTTDGLKRFDGNDFKNVLPNLVEYFDYDFVNIFAVAYDDKYYLNSSLTIDGELKKVIIEITSNNETAQFYNFDKNIISGSVIKNDDEYKLIFVCEDDSVRSICELDKNANNVNAKFLSFNKVYFDSEEIKQINSIRFLSKGNFSFKIITDIESREFLISDNFSLENILIKGHVFEFVISGTDMFEIEAIFIEVLTLEDSL